MKTLRCSAFQGRPSAHRPASWGATEALAAIACEASM
jgi:hypothetical protein